MSGGLCGRDEDEERSTGELAAGGTVFLDEIGELPLSMQTKILTFLDHKKFKRVGGLEDIEVDASDRGDKPESGTRRKAGNSGKTFFTGSMSWNL